MDEHSCWASENNILPEVCEQGQRIPAFCREVKMSSVVRDVLAVKCSLKRWHSSQPRLTTETETEISIVLYCILHNYV